MSNTDNAPELTTSADLRHATWTRLFDSLPIAGLHVRADRRCTVEGAPDTQAVRVVVAANEAARALFEAPDFETLRQHVEVQLRQPGVDICINSALTPPYQPRECFGLPMIATSGRELLLRVTSTRLSEEADDSAIVALFMEDAAPFERLRFNNDAYRMRVTQLAQARDREAESTKAALLSRDRLAEVLLEIRSGQTAAHMKRVAILAEQIGRRMGMGRPELAQLVTAARLHDIGIMHVPVELLARSGAVTEAERRLIEEHPANAAKILSSAGYAPAIVTAAEQHHERSDGSGYPAGLRAEEISRPARILAVADVMDAMMAPRAYRPSLDLGSALEALEQQSFRFDTAVVEVCREVCLAPDPLAMHMADAERAAMSGLALAAANPEAE